MKNRFLEENAVKLNEIEYGSYEEIPPDEENLKTKKKKRKNKQAFEENSMNVEDGFDGESLPDEENLKTKNKKKKKKRASEEVRTSGLELENFDSNDEETDCKKLKRKKRLLKEAAKAAMRGVCYLSRIPPHMDPLKLRQILSQYGEIQRIYLAPEDPAAQVKRKRAGGFRGQMFSEGWVEFTDKRVAKRVADMLNGEQIGGKKRSSFYFDLWNIKYLSKFKWDDLTEEIAYKNAIREQKLALEISAAKRERDFYLTKVDQSRALNSIAERLTKKQKIQQESGTNSEFPISHQVAKVIREFPQTKPVADNAAQSKPKLSKDILAGVFAGS